MCNKEEEKLKKQDRHKGREIDRRKKEGSMKQRKKKKRSRKSENNYIG